MVRPVAVIRETWSLYTPIERRNIAIYIAGIMLYKFGLEAFNGSVIALATNRYDELEKRTHISITFQRVGVLTGLNQAFQCVGSILIAPLIKRYRTHEQRAVDSGCSDWRQVQASGTSSRRL
jgi:hypothetical protein